METIGQDAANDDVGVIHIQAEDNTFDSTDEVINVTSSSDIERNRANCTPVDDNTLEYFPLSRYNSSSNIHENVSEPQTGFGNVDNLVLNNSNGVCNSNCSLCLVEKNSAANGDLNVDQRELILEEQPQQIQDVPGSNLDFNSKNWSDFHTLMNAAVSDYTKEEPILGRSSEGASRPDSQPSFLPFPLTFYDPYSYWKNYFRDLNPTKDEGDHPGTSILNNNHTWSEKVGNILAHTHHIRTRKSEDAATNLQVPSYHDFPCQNRLGLSRINDSFSNVESYQGYTLTAMPKQPYYRRPFYNYQSSSRFEHGKPAAAASDFPFFCGYNQSSSFNNTVNERLLSNQAQSNPSSQIYLEMPYKGESSLAEKPCTDTASEAGPSGNYFTEYANPETSSRTSSPTPASTFLQKELAPHPPYATLIGRNLASVRSPVNSPFSSSQPHISKYQQNQSSSSKFIDRLRHPGASSAFSGHFDLEQHSHSFTHSFQHASTTTEDNQAGSNNQDMYAEYLLKRSCTANSSLYRHKLASVTPFPNKVMGPEAKKILENWFYENIHDPYPSRNEKEALSLKTGLSIPKISSWFCSTRKKVIDRDPTAFVMKHKGRRHITHGYLPRQNYAENMHNCAENMHNYAENMHNHASYPPPPILHSHVVDLPSRLAMAFAASSQSSASLYPNMVIQDHSDEDHPLTISDTPEPQ